MRLHDLRYALRRLRANRRFSSAVLFVLAIGIGTFTPTFTIVHATMVRPLEPCGIGLEGERQPDLGRIHFGGRADGAYLRVLGRVHHDVACEQAERELAAIAAALAREYPALNRIWTTTVRPLLEAVLGTGFSRAVLAVARDEDDVPGVSDGPCGSIPSRPYDRSR